MTVSIIAALALLYLTFVFVPIPFVRYWRDIWIETAMTTGNHHWLATNFIPGYIIDEVMSRQVIGGDIVGGRDYLDETADTGKTPPDETEPPETVPGDNPSDDDILGQKSLKVGDIDYAGYKVLVNDIDEGIVISEIVGSGFRGKVMLIDDPARVFVGVTNKPGVEGLRILTMMSRYGAVAGINASGFYDPGGEGSGGEPMGYCTSEGNFWGTGAWGSSIVLTETNKLVVGTISNWQNYNIRDGIQFGPVLVADGVQKVTGSAGWGIQPRTAIGQRADGVIIMLVIDGRDVTHSIGCTVGELAEIMLKYEAVNASCCDGGASSVMAYGGEVITKNSSLNPTIGRRLPNAFLVKSKKAG